MGYEVLNNPPLNLCICHPYSLPPSQPIPTLFPLLQTFGVHSDPSTPHALSHPTSSFTLLLLLQEPSSMGASQTKTLIVL